MFIFTETLIKDEMEKITFEELPKAVADLHDKIDFLTSILEAGREEVDRLMPLDELLEYLPEKPARQTVYGWVNDRKIPYEKHGKYLYFRKSSIDEWLKSGRR